MVTQQLSQNLFIKKCTIKANSKMPHPPRALKIGSKVHFNVAISCYQLIFHVESNFVNGFKTLLSFIKNKLFYKHFQDK